MDKLGWVSRVRFFHFLHHNHHLKEITDLWLLATFDEEAWYIKYPVLLAAGIGAVIIATPSLVSSVWGWVSSRVGGGSRGRYTTRSSFARGASYEAVDDDEGELLGDDSEEEV